MEEHVKMLLNDEKKFEECLGPMFKNYDVDGDGAMSYDELKNLLKEALIATFGKNIEIPDKSFRNLFTKLDTNKSGSISKKEIRIFIKTIFKFVIEGKIKVA